MKLVSFDQVKLEDVNIEGALGTGIRWLISQKDNAPNFALRMFEVKPGGNTPFHKHAWEHEVFVLEGEGALVLQGETKPFKRYDSIYVDPEMMHQFRNEGDTTMKFLCIVPHQTPAEAPKKKAKNPFASGTANNC
ncbi:MAG: cupin [Candidatus Cloacimonetes bacterium 4572_65]|nr:MAG: cupin [Candidatus Cloacimonetes bacterium 4572_65]